MGGASSLLSWPSGSLEGLSILCCIAINILNGYMKSDMKYSRAKAQLALNRICFISAAVARCHDQTQLSKGWRYSQRDNRRLGSILRATGECLLELLRRWGLDSHTTSDWLADQKKKRNNGQFRAVTRCGNRTFTTILAIKIFVQTMLGHRWAIQKKNDDKSDL